MLGDVRDHKRLALAFSGADAVIHAAALKRIESIEYSPGEGIATNVIGTMNVVDAAREARVGVTVVLSSDKSIAPLNIYGCTKMLAERYAITANSYLGGSGDRVVAVRYGNVLASRGSIVEIVTRARDLGRPIPITDPAMTRFWITLDRAVDTVFYAIKESVCGQVFVPKMRASDLGLLCRVLAPGSPVSQIPVKRGEKWHETAISAEEARETYDTGDDGYYVIGARETGIAHGWQRVLDGFELRSDTAPHYTENELALVLMSIGALGVCKGVSVRVVDNLGTG